MIYNILFILLFLVGRWTLGFSFQHQSDSTKAFVKKTEDFTVTGDGESSNWKAADWIAITEQESSSTKKLTTRVKILYSSLGIYFLFQCEDQKLSATLLKDNTALFKEDVIEVFLWPDQSVPIYFEYELSPLNYELPILVLNMNGRTQGWLPWHYEGKRKIQHATSVHGGDKKSNASVKSWTAEIFMPFSILGPLVASPPKSGTAWRANLYRIDYDEGYTTWTWQKTTKGIGGNFHEYKKFGTLVFE